MKSEDLQQQSADEQALLKQLIQSKRTAVNWNALPEDHFLVLGWKQLKSQLWFAEDVAISRDREDWVKLSADERTTYSKGLAVLTMLDTYQGDLGAASMALALPEEDHHAKALINFMAMTENFIHAKSYSNIFQTLLTPVEEEELFAWVNSHEIPQMIMNSILTQYVALKEDLHNPIKLWKAMVASVYLETWLFYSGFFYPLFQAAHSRLTGSGEIINLIVRDEQVHGLLIGKLSQPLFASFSDELKKELEQWAVSLMQELYLHQERLIHELYDVVGLSEEITLFTRYNADKALLNLNFAPHFGVSAQEVNPMVMNGLLSKSKDVDMFSMVGNGYMHASDVTLDLKQMKDDGAEFDF